MLRSGLASCIEVVNVRVEVAFCGERSSVSDPSGVNAVCVLRSQLKTLCRWTCPVIKRLSLIVGS